ncbi:MAG: Crp/Fnr family transcriptional regulator [Acidobacteria bacterium]|nr:Crp/Fnr family transcriptional regulator [Acidobacteriota bacterium]
MRTPYGIEIIESCLTCSLRADRMFCDLPAETLSAFDAISYVNLHPRGAVLFVEGQEPRGIYVVCGGRVKLSTCGTDGKTIITHIAEAGEVLGLSATISGQPHEVTAELLEPGQTNFVRRDDFMRFLREHSEACLRVAEHLSRHYHDACTQIRSLGLSQSAAEKLAKHLIEWSAKGVDTGQGIRLKLTLTQEEIAEIIGTSRETVTRLLADFKKKQIVQLRGSTLQILDRDALKALAKS